MSDFLERLARLPQERLALLAAELKDRLDRAERALAARTEPIAIVGAGCRFPGGGNDPESYWQSLANGIDAVREVPAERWTLDAVYDSDPDAPGKVGSRWGSFLDHVDMFDALLFGIAPREASAVDPQQRLLLEVAWEALEDAGIAADGVGGTLGGVYIGLCNHDYQELMLERPLTSVDAHIAAGSAGSMAAGRLSYVLGLQGPAITIDTACSSSLVALHLACESLRNGESQLAIAGGVNLILGVTTTVGLTKAHMISPGGRCRAFDEDADGIVRGEGCGVVVLKRLSDAVAAGDDIKCVIRATAVNQDGRSSGITAPNGPAQEALMRSALQRAGLRAEQIDYIEAHGTGTRLGDPIEVRAIGAVYGARSPQHPLRIGSVKTNLGHLEAAAGIAGILKVVMALRHRQLPPHLHLQKRNPLIEWERWPIDIPTRLSAWEPAAADSVRRAAVSSFGFSGTNSHVILEEYSAPAPKAVPSTSAQLLALSARTPTALRALAKDYAGALSRQSLGQTSFADFCASAAFGRARFGHRACVVASSADEAAGPLQAFAAGQSSAVIHERSVGQFEPVLLFTGQGSQYVDMGRALFETEPVFRVAIERCDAQLRSFDLRLIDTLYPTATTRAAAAERINETLYAQPALFAVEYALAELWRSWGIEAAAVAGHSVGEFAAAVACGALDVDSALRLIATRAAAMQRLPKGGTMAAVFADATSVARMLQGSSAEIAAHNSPANTVITGPAAAVSAALADFAARGIETRALQVSHAFHSAMLDPILSELERCAASLQFSEPQVPFHSTLTGASIDGAVLATGAYWRDQARRPVLFSETLMSLRAAGHKVFLEIGPHPTLTALGMAALVGGDAAFLPSLRRGGDDRAELLRSAAQLHARGAEPIWGALFGGPRARIKIPGYPYERSSYWLGWSERAHGRDRAAAPQRAPQADLSMPFANTLWRRDWLPLDGAADLAAPADIGRRLVPQVAELVSEHGGEVYRLFLPRLDALCTAYIGKALRDLGIALAPGGRVAEDALPLEHGVLPAHRKLVGRMFKILEEDGVIVPTADRDWGVQDATAAQQDAAALLHDILHDFPSCRAEASLTGRCAERLADVLRGKCDPMELLFPGGSLELTERLYADTPSFRVFNTLVARAVRLAAQESRTVRVLELGAGTGGTAAQLLPLLRGSGARYTFTDVSGIFLDRARNKFREFDFVNYQLLDVSRTVAAQGFESHAFDVVVASNVLHATPDLAAALANVKELLAPGGLLVMLEGFRPQRFGDLTVGLTPGWWHFTDAATRPDYALIGARNWTELLTQRGFEDVTITPPPLSDDAGLLAQQGLVIARAPAARDESAGKPHAVSRWLAFAQRGKASAQFASELAGAGLNVQVADPLETDSFDYAGAVRSFAGAAGSWGLLHLLSIDETTRADDDGMQVLAAQRRSTGSALAAAQAAVANMPAPVVFITRSSQTISETVELGGACLSGLVRTMAVEHPDVRARVVDLPPQWRESAAQVAGLLRGGLAPSEDELALRDDRWFGPRIVAHRVGETAPIRFDAGGSYVVTGGLGGLGLRVAQWLVERGAGRVVLAARGAPSDVALAAIERMRATGAEIVVVRGDVADLDTVRSIARAADPGRLKGVLHAAGVTADAVLLRQDWPHFEKVMRAKVAGAWNLHRETRALALDHFVMFSTGAAFLGSSGQSNHAAANAFLGGLASLRRTQGLPGIAIDWGAWTEIGAATRGDVIERAGASGLGALTPDTGLEILERLMRDPSSRVAAVPIDWSLFLTKQPALRERAVFHGVAASSAKETTATASGEAAAGELANSVRGGAAANRRGLLFDGVHDIAARALGMAAHDQIDSRVPLTELGLDSLMAVELRNALALQLGQSLPATLLFSYPTLDELTDHLMAELGVANASDEAASAVAAERLDAMDEDEMAALLERKLGA